MQGRGDAATASGVARGRTRMMAVAWRLLPHSGESSLFDRGCHALVTEPRHCDRLVVVPRRCRPPHESGISTALRPCPRNLESPACESGSLAGILRPDRPLSPLRPRPDHQALHSSHASAHMPPTWRSPGSLGSSLSTLGDRQQGGGLDRRAQSWPDRPVENRSPAYLYRVRVGRPRRAHLAGEVPA